MATAPSPHRLPVLTEVVLVPGQDSALSGEPMAEPFTEQIPLDTPPPIPLREFVELSPLDENAIAQRVMVDLQRQIDLMFEHRMRETLSPALARMTDMLLREVRGQLGSTLREMVERAVALELSRQRRG
jgi:hypothetical protein